MLRKPNPGGRPATGKIRESNFPLLLNKDEREHLARLTHDANVSYDLNMSQGHWLRMRAFDGAPSLEELREKQKGMRIPFLRRKR